MRNIVIRTQGEPMAYLHAIRKAVASVEADEQVGNGIVRPGRGDPNAMPLWSRERLFSILFGFFSGLALLLALVGLFSVVAWSVTQRTAEFGVRLALGASRGHIVWVAARAAADRRGTGDCSWSRRGLCPGKESGSMDEQPERWVGKHSGSGSASDPVLRYRLRAGGQSSGRAASHRGASLRVAKPDDRSGDCSALESGADHSARTQSMSDSAI